MTIHLMTIPYEASSPYDDSPYDDSPYEAPSPYDDFHTKHHLHMMIHLMMIQATMTRL